jgi:hypothetical protein
MFLVLLGFGAVLSVAGMALARAGLSLREGTFDASLFTPGIIAAIGGLLLIGLDLVLRTLQQIERTLAARAMPRAVQMPIAGSRWDLGRVRRRGRICVPAPNETGAGCRCRKHERR